METIDKEMLEASDTPSREVSEEEMATVRELFMERLECVSNIIENAHELDPINCHVVGDIKGLNLLNDNDMLEIQSILAMDLDKYPNGAKMELNGMQDGRVATISKTCYATETEKLIYKYSIEVEIRKGDIEGVYKGVDF